MKQRAPPEDAGGAGMELCITDMAAAAMLPHMFRQRGGLPSERKGGQMLEEELKDAEAALEIPILNESGVCRHVNLQTCLDQSEQ